MTVETITFAGADGQPVTTGLSGYDIAQTSGGTLTFDESWTPRGSNVAIRADGSTTSGTVYNTKTITPTDVVAFDIPVTPKTLPSSELYIIFFGSGTGSTRCFALTTTSAGVLRVRDSANGLAWASDTPALVADSPCIISVYATRASSDGTFRVVVYEEDGTTIRVDSGVQTDQATGADQVVSFRVGAKASTSALASSWLYGEPRWDVDASGLIPAWEPDPEPSAASPAYRWDGTEYAPLSAYGWDGAGYAPIVSV